MSYVLKHEQFAHLRENISNNYQICTSKEESWRLLFDMFDEVLEATAGGRFFHVGTDESWFYGTGVDCPCKEKVKEIGRSGMFVEFVLTASKYLEERGREFRFWGESPLEIEDIPKLPSTVIDAVAGYESLDRKGELRTEKEHGIRVMIYDSAHGEEAFFPNYPQSLKHIYQTMSLSDARKIDVLGTLVAAWDDLSDLHNELFWAGWVVGSSCGWHGGTPSVDEMISRFMTLFYGPQVSNMEKVYELMHEGSEFWTKSWDKVPSLHRIHDEDFFVADFGSTPLTIKYRHIELPNLPEQDTLFNHPYWARHYQNILEDIAEEKEAHSRLLIELLNDNLSRVSRNKYNLEVMLSTAEYMHHNLNLFKTLAGVEETLSAASEKREYHHFDEAISHIRAAEKLVEGICREREDTFNELVKVWEISRYPKGRSVGDKRYVHVIDTWGGWGNRTPDLSFFVIGERKLNLEKWIYHLKAIRQGFALEHQFEITYE
jgi:hypothetical protein